MYRYSFKTPGCNPWFCREHPHKGEIWHVRVTGAYDTRKSVSAIWQLLYMSSCSSFHKQLQIDFWWVTFYVLSTWYTYQVIMGEFVSTLVITIKYTALSPHQSLINRFQSIVDQHIKNIYGGHYAMLPRCVLMRVVVKYHHIIKLYFHGCTRPSFYNGTLDGLSALNNVLDIKWL